MELVKQIYQLTKRYPKDEQYGLTSQTKRAAVSIPANIAEGVGRQYKKDTLQFLHIARGSIFELETLLKVAVMVEILKEEDFVELKSSIDQAARILSGLIKYMRKEESLR